MQQPACPVVAGQLEERDAVGGVCSRQVTREIDVLNAFTSQNLCDIEFTMVEMESAREVTTIGTRAPMRMVAASAPPRNVSDL